MTTTAAPALAPHSYSTYLEYLEAIKDTWPEYTGLRKYLERHSVYNLDDTNWSLSIRDVLSDGSYIESTRIYLGAVVEHRWETTDFKALRSALSSNLDNVRTRFIVAAQDRRPLELLSPALIDAIGLALDIEPLFFCSLITYPNLAPPRHPSFLKLGSIHFKILKRELPGLRTVPMCIVIDQPPWRRGCLNYKSPDGEFNDWNKARYLLNETPSIFDQIAQHKIGRWSFTNPPLFDIFDQLICGQKDDSSNIDVLRGLCAIVRFQTSRFKTDTNSTTHSLWKWRFDSITAGGLKVPNDSHTKSISLEWNRLRSALEDFRSSARALKRFVSRNFNESPIFNVLIEVSADQEDAQADAEALEQELRDSLQMDVGRLSLEESRRSIEESKRVKLRKFHLYIELVTL
ncbi:hypothetical protein MMC27_007903 [Xylographa pallens]|nr:hypothetical protein [Xylographa pallens]